jgi:protein-tyrosine-phosphatase
MKTLIPFLMGITLITQTMAQNKKIIFVCEHGAAKSVIAATYFNEMAKERNLEYAAECRGTFPDSVVAPGIRDGLTKDKLFDATMQPRKLLASDTSDVERIILFTPLPSYMDGSIKTEDWSNIENVDAEYSKRRDAIVKKISELLDTLEKQK